MQAGVPRQFQDLRENSLRWLTSEAACTICPPPPPTSGVWRTAPVFHSLRPKGVAVSHCVTWFESQLTVTTPPPPLVLTRACRNTATPDFRTFGSFLQPSFLRFQSTRERGVCSVVQAAAGVHVGGNVWVQVYFHVLLRSGVCAGLLDARL